MTIDEDSDQRPAPTSWPDVAISALEVVGFLGFVYLVLYFFSHFS